jgi:YidC/Oxa1 family membrane protein insertase
MTALFHTLVSYPLYNGLVLLIKLFPFFDAGVVVIIFTIIVKFILLPLSIKASRAQIEMKTHERALNTIKEKYKDNKEEQGKKTIEYYKEKGINPFASIFILLIQLPIILGLYRVLLKYGLPMINTSILYSFISPPTGPVNMIFLHTINIADKSIILAIIAGITTYFQISLATANTATSTTKDMQGDIARAMSVQMKYFFPIIVAFISYSISAALCLYWITSNVFAIVQEMYIKRKYHKTVFVE